MNDYILYGHPRHISFIMAGVGIIIITVHHKLLLFLSHLCHWYYHESYFITFFLFIFRIDKQKKRVKDAAILK